MSISEDTSMIFKSKYMAIAILFVLLCLTMATIVIIKANRNPIAEFITEDGKLQIPGGKFTPELQKFLSTKRERLESYIVQEIDRKSSYPTMSFNSIEFKNPTPIKKQVYNVEPNGFTNALGKIWDEITSFLGGILDFFFMNAQAADRYLVLGDGACTAANIATDVDCWAAGSGGAGGAGVPGAGDAAIIDANSGAGTGTQDAAMDVLSWTQIAGTTTWATGNFALTSQSTFTHTVGTFQAGSSTITVNGNVNIQQFTYGTSNFVFNANGNYTSCGDNNACRFYDAIVNVGVTITMTTAMRYGHVLTVNGTIDGGNHITTVGATTGGLVMGGAGDISATGRFWYAVSAGIITGTTYGIQLLIGTAGTWTLGDDTGVGATGLTIGGGAILDTNTKNLTVGAIDVQNVNCAILWSSGTHTISGQYTNISTSASWDAGSGAVYFTSSNDVNMTFGDMGEAEFYNVYFQSGNAAQRTFTMQVRGLWWSNILGIASATILATSDLLLTGGSIQLGCAAGNNSLTANASTVSVVGVTFIAGGGTDIITITNGAWTVSGNWNTNQPATQFVQGTGTVTYTGIGSITMLAADNNFANLTINSAGTATAGSDIDVDTTFTAQSGLMDMGGNDFTATTFNMTGGNFTAGATVAVSGNVNISNVNSYIIFGTSTWTVAGTWTNVSTNAAVWDAGTSSITFTSATGGNMTFANLGEAEFYNITFTSSGAGAQTFTMLVNGLRWGNNLTISDAGATTALATGDFALNGSNTGSIVVGNGGILTANASTITGVVDVDMVGGASGIITITTGTWTLSGNWDTSGAGSTFTQGTGTVIMTGGAGSITMLAADNDFGNLDISGTITLLSNVDSDDNFDISGTLQAGAFNIGFVDLNIVGTMVMDGQTVTGMYIDTSAGTITLTDWTLFDVANDDIRWTFNPNTAGAIITITVNNLQANISYRLSRDGTGIVDETADGTGTVTFAVTGGWSPHLMLIGLSPGGGGIPGTGTGSSPGTIRYNDVGTLIVEFYVVNEKYTVKKIEWAFGDGKKEIADNVIRHMYARDGIYTVMAHVLYVDNRSENISVTITVYPGAGLWQYIVTIMFIIGAIGAIATKHQKKKVFLSMIALVGIYIMITTFGLGQFPLFLTRQIMQSIMVLGTIVTWVYSIAPSTDKKQKKARLWWIIWGALALILYAFTISL